MQVCVMGYAIISIALVLFVQAKNVYPQLLLGRLCFSLGGAAASTMVTAVLPTMSFAPHATLDGPSGDIETPIGNSTADGRAAPPSISPDLPATLPGLKSRSPSVPHELCSPESASSDSTSATSYLAGYVGLFAGCGALIALAIFLPLPASFQHRGTSPERALQYSFYVVAGLALMIAVVCFFGLKNLPGEGHKAFRNLVSSGKGIQIGSGQARAKAMPLWRHLYAAFMLGLRRPEIGLGYLGGFVARASSVGISLFVPLLVNALFLSSGHCSNKGPHTPRGLPDIKRRCPRAYTLAAALTGVSQLVALLSAPIFGYLSAKVGRFNWPLVAASLAGIIGYPIFATQFTPNDYDRGRRILAFLSMSLVGISQIGAIVCSLAVLSRGVLKEGQHSRRRRHATVPVGARVGTNSTASAGKGAPDEQTTLLSGPPMDLQVDLPDLKGSIAGIYSLYGGAGILLLTKLGGFLFDRSTFGAPFYIMTTFNGILLVACLSTGLANSLEASK